MPIGKPTQGSLLTVLLPFLGLSMILLPIFRNSINPDGISYLRIADYYLKGDLSAALNTHWSPLLSWLLLPFYALHIPWLIAFRLLNVLIAGLCLFKLHQIVHHSFSDLTLLTRNLLLWAMAAQLLVLEFHVVTPDLLLLCFLLYLLYDLLEDNMLKHPVATGILGALLFLAKAYGFYFFIGSVGLYLLIKGGKERFRNFRKDLKQGFSKGSLLKLSFAFLLPCVAWVFAMSYKYHEIRLSSAPAYNYAMMDSNGTIHHPSNEFQKLLALPYSRAYFAWEDPGVAYRDLPRQQTVDRNIPFYIRLIGHNLKNIAALIKRLYPVLFLVFPCLIWLLFAGGPDWRQWTTYWTLIGFSALYCSGYLVILVVDRYVYLLLFTLMILLYGCLDKMNMSLGKGIQTGKRILLKNLLLVLTTLYFLVTSIYMIMSMSGSKTYKDKELSIFRSVGRTVPPGARLATYYTRDLWGLTFQYDLHDMGGIAGYSHWAELERDLQKYQVNLLILTDSTYFEKIPSEIAGHLTLVHQDSGVQYYTIHY